VHESSGGYQKRFEAFPRFETDRILLPILGTYRPARQARADELITSRDLLAFGAQLPKNLERRNVSFRREKI
jgi:hypothetical protein